ncbi:C-type lectin 37Da-like [Drosophila rhopaloa]|uniref:Macrophage mannose receptor 1-like n=1 Tax=Drosophila rhopaloa TaxID=1041015 RepID=A0A6P4F192_DRORH|nr:C-type lectin 37Da-like [Drosophila rhopaloa]
MFLKFTGLCAFLAIISSSAAYKITPNVIDGVPGFLNITTAPFVKIGSGYYVFKSEKVNWYAAFESCRQMDAELIAFENLEELELISQYVTESNLFPRYWTSGTDLAEEDKHTWFSNGQPVSSTLWLPGEPNKQDDVEHCDEFNIKNGGGGLNDRFCIRLNGYICEAHQPKTASFIIW